MTADELLHMPPDEFKYELVKGILRKMSPSGQKHGKVAGRIFLSMALHVKTNRLGEVYAAETGFKIASDPDTVRAPDAAFVTQQRVEQAGDVEGFFPGPPDLAVEVISPSDSYTEVEEKVLEWLESGCRMIVVANPRKAILTVYRSLNEIKALTETDVLNGEDVVPGWILPVKGIFD